MGQQTWTVKAALDWTREYLAEKGDPHPRRSAEWLLSAATSLSRVELYAYHDRPLAPPERESLREAVKRRAAGEPLQYVTGEVAFRHIVVKVRAGVLIPRPETEVLAGVVIDALRDAAEPLVADVCTGSGCVGLSIASELPRCRVVAADISPRAVAIARENAVRLGLDDRVDVFEGDLLSGLPPASEGQYSAVVANPPYVPSAEVDKLEPQVVGYEPRLALDGGPDGLDVFRQLASQAARWLAPRGLFAVELDERRVETAAQEAVEWYEQVKVVTDLAGRDRVLTGIRRG